MLSLKADVQRTEEPQLELTECLVEGDLIQSSGRTLGEHSDLLGWHLLLCSSSRDVDVWVVIDLVTFPQVLYDVKVGAGCLC